MKIAEVERHILKRYRARNFRTIFLQGPPGIGKSDSAKNAAAKLRAEYRKQLEGKLSKEEFEKLTEDQIFGLRQWQATIEDPLELPGLPAVIGNKAVRVPFEDKIPTTGRGILIIDEINSASTLIQASLYSLVLDKKLGGTVLGDGWMIIATGNSDGDRGVTQRIPTPLVSRMGHIKVEHDLDSWLSWMAIQGSHDTVRAFMKHAPGNFVKFDPKIPGPFATARTWTMVSEEMITYGDEIPPLEVIEGWVGEGPAREFCAYATRIHNLVNLDEIISNPSKAKVPEKDPGAMYAITTGLAGRFTFQNITAIITYLDRIPKEFAAYCISAARDIDRGRLERMTEEEKKKQPKMRENKTFARWALDNHDFIIDN